MKKIILVGCCAQKLTTVALAKDLYRSPLFKKSAAWAEQQGCEWFILSAKYGVIKPHGHIASYDSSITKMTKNERNDWNESVAIEIKSMMLTWGVKKLQVIIMAGKSYIGWIELLSDIEVHQPMEGLQIGQRLSWLNEQIQGIGDT